MISILQMTKILFVKDICGKVAISCFVLYLWFFTLLSLNKKPRIFRYD